MKKKWIVCLILFLLLLIGAGRLNDDNHRRMDSYFELSPSEGRSKLQTTYEHSTRYYERFQPREYLRVIRVSP